VLDRIKPGRNRFVVAAIHVNPFTIMGFDQIRRTGGSPAAIPSKPDPI
jgi:hypothetical protein